jgi:hypothetical protein|tara:strand:- start:92 stop:328 length:237 start_codon:yes stop_codon:yes gene_type:complete
MQCQDDWFRKFGERALDHFGRIHEPIKLTADNAWYKDYDYSYNPNGSSRTNHRFVNDLLGERRPITEAQFNDESFVSP